MIEILHKDTGEVLARLDVDSLVGADLTARDLRGADLSTVDPGGFTVMNLANLEKANLRNANLRGILAEHARFRFSDLGHVEFAHAVWSGSNRHRANVSDANFEGVEMATVNMEYANCSEAKNVDIPPYKDHVR